MPIHHRPPPPGLLASARQWSQADAPTREQEMHRQRAMAGQPGYPSIGPPQSRMSRIWENLRHGIPRRTREFLEPETPAEMGGLLGASIVPGVGEAIDVADFAAGWKDRDPGRMGWAAGGLMLPFVAGSTMRKVSGKVAKAADEFPMDEASRMARRTEPAKQQYMDFIEEVEAIEESTPGDLYLSDKMVDHEDVMQYYGDDMVEGSPEYWHNAYSQAVARAAGGLENAGLNLNDLLGRIVY